jgi:DNA-binding transcriptional LysR family regulator
MSRSTVDLVALKVFLKVGTTGNMTAAAQALGMTQSGVSQVIQQLESELGVILLDRTRRPLRLTAAGSILARRAERLVEEADHLPAAVREASLVPEIRVGLVDSFAGTVGPHLIRPFMERVSTITIWAGLTPPLSQALLNRQVDVIVASEAMDDVDSVRRDTLLRESFVLALPKSVRLTRNDLTLETLADRLPLIRYSARSAIGIQIDRHLRRLGIAAPRRVELDSSDTLFAMVAAGVGWAITTPLCVLHGRPDPAAVRIERLPGPGFTRNLTMIAREGEYQQLIDRLATTARTALRESCLPAMRNLIPWLGDEIVVQ